MTTIVRAVQTCDGFPAQWDAWDETGRYLYLRFRSGIGTAETYPGPDFYATREPGQLLAIFDVDDRWAGEIDLGEFCERADFRLSLGSTQHRTVAG